MTPIILPAILPTILIVEDTDECRETLEMSLSKISGVIVRSVATAEEALAHAATECICALVTDLGLPRMNGFELIENFRSQSAYSELPVLVVSGETGLQTRERVTAAGANAFLTKPFSPCQVRSEIIRLMDAAKRVPFPGPLLEDSF
ncbi:MAG: response regulator [Bryobacteraceae bacterium]